MLQTWSWKQSPGRILTNIEEYPRDIIKANRKWMKYSEEILSIISWRYNFQTNLRFIFVEDLRSLYPLNSPIWLLIFFQFLTEEMH